MSKTVLMKGFVIQHFPKFGTGCLYSQIFSTKEQAEKVLKKYNRFYEGRKRPKVIGRSATVTEYSEQEKKELGKLTEGMNNAMQEWWRKDEKARVQNQRV